jgi:hypothetical protein
MSKRNCTGQVPGTFPGRSRPKTAVCQSRLLPQNGSAKYLAPNFIAGITDAALTFYERVVK